MSLTLFNIFNKIIEIRYYLVSFFNLVQFSDDFFFNNIFMVFKSFNVLFLNIPN